MTEDDLCYHARKRIQQRGIPPYILELLDQFGSIVHCCGAERLIFDKAAKKRLKRHLGGTRGLQLIERWLNVYAVIGSKDGRVVTVARQSNHIRRD